MVPERGKPVTKMTRSLMFQPQMMGLTPQSIADLVADLKGLYGSDAVAGVVHIITRGGAESPALQAQLMGGRGARVGAQADGGYGAVVVGLKLVTDPGDEVIFSLRTVPFTWLLAPLLPLGVRPRSPTTITSLLLDELEHKQGRQ